MRSLRGLFSIEIGKKGPLVRPPLTHAVPGADLPILLGKLVRTAGASEDLSSDGGPLNKSATEDRALPAPFGNAIASPQHGRIEP